jgi:hypothetical protein
MIGSSRKKQFYPLMSALLVFAVFGSLVFSKVELPNNFEICEKPFSKGAFAPFDYNIYWLTGDTSFIGKAKKIHPSYRKEHRAYQCLPGYKVRQNV